MPRIKVRMTTPAEQRRIRARLKREAIAKRQARKLQNRVKRVENIINKTIEKKHTDWLATTVDGDEITNTTPVNKAAFFRIQDTGAGESKRIGNKVNLLSQRFQCNLVKGGPGDKIVRVLIVNNPNYESSATLDPQDVLEYWQWSTDGFQIFTSPYKIGADASKKYKVLYDRTFSLTDDKPYYTIDFMKKYGTVKSPGKVVNFELDTSDFPNDHRVSMFALTDHTGSTNAPRITMFARNKYIDM